MRRQKYGNNYSYNLILDSITNCSLFPTSRELFDLRKYTLKYLRHNVIFNFHLQTVYLSAFFKMGYTVADLQYWIISSYQNFFFLRK